MAKKSLLRVMTEHCSATRDKMSLYYLCSRHGTRLRARGGCDGPGFRLLTSASALEKALPVGIWQVRTPTMPCGWPARRFWTS